MDNNELSPIDIQNINREDSVKDITTFVESLFLCMGRKISNGIAIEMDRGSNLVVSFYERKKGEEVIISMDGIEMGEIKPYSGQGYKYSFTQYGHKVKFANLQRNEHFMEEICNNNNLIKLIKAH